MYFVLALLTLLNNAWYSDKHFDGSAWEGWFIAGVEIEEGKQITYHLPNKYLRIAGDRLTYKDRAPEWDGHTSADVLSRLTDWIDNGARILPKD